MFFKHGAARDTSAHQAHERPALLFRSKALACIQYRVKSASRCLFALDRTQEAALLSIVLTKLTDTFGWQTRQRIS